MRIDGKLVQKCWWPAKIVHIVDENSLKISWELCDESTALVPFTSVRRRRFATPDFEFSPGDNVEALLDELWVPATVIESKKRCVKVLVEGEYHLAVERHHLSIGS